MKRSDTINHDPEPCLETSLDRFPVLLAAFLHIALLRVMSLADTECEPVILAICET
jgi:hypothetical protein